MTSLASLEHHAVLPAFNSTFYATAATVIPVLFLAIAVQGHSYENMLKATARGNRRLQQIRRDHRPTRGRWEIFNYDILTILLTLNLFMLATGAAMIILTYGVIGEIDAVLSLYFSRPVGVKPYAVIYGTILLTIAAAGGPALAFVRFWRDQLAESRGKAPSPEGRSDQDDPA